MDDAVVGPIDCVLLDFDAEQSLDEVADSLSGLIETGVIRLYDIVGVHKGADGSVTGIEVADMHGVAVFAGARSGLLGDDDVAVAADTMDAGTTALLMLYENAWAVPVVAATRRAGGFAFAVSHITGQQINDALDELDKGD